MVSKRFKTTAPVPTSTPNSTLEKALLIIEENFHDIKISEISKNYLSVTVISAKYLRSSVALHLKIIYY